MKESFIPSGVNASLNENIMSRIPRLPIGRQGREGIAGSGSVPGFHVAVGPLAVRVLVAGREGVTVVTVLGCARTGLGSDWAGVKTSSWGQPRLGETKEGLELGLDWSNAEQRQGKAKARQTLKIG